MSQTWVNSNRGGGSYGARDQGRGQRSSQASGGGRVWPPMVSAQDLPPVVYDAIYRQGLGGIGRGSRPAAQAPSSASGHAAGTGAHNTQSGFAQSQSATATGGGFNSSQSASADVFSSGWTVQDVPPDNHKPYGRDRDQGACNTGWSGGGGGGRGSHRASRGGHRADDWGDMPPLPDTPQGGFADAGGKTWSPAMVRHFDNMQVGRRDKPEEIAAREREQQAFQGGFGGGGFAGLEEILAAEKSKWDSMPPVAKDFYREHPEVTAMSEEEVLSLRKEKNDVNAENVDNDSLSPIPRLVYKFSHAWIDYPQILANLRDVGFEKPSPIQSQMWPVLLSGRDCVGIAQTGSGKTIGFLLPAFVHMDKQPTPQEDRDGPTCLVLSPTRELALQIRDEVKKYTYKKIRNICLYGGGPRVEMIDLLNRGVEIVIATPGRLNDLVSCGSLTLSSISYLVLDEADRMLDMGFEPQIRGILNSIRPDRHTVMTSATWPPQVRALAQQYTKDAVLVVVGSLDLTACKDVQQTVIMLHFRDKKQNLLDIIRDRKPNDKHLIFVARKATTRYLKGTLQSEGIDCDEISGDCVQGERERTLRDFKSGAVRVVVATDVASRGIDISDITHVINYDFPSNMEDYVHRVGRAGRAGRQGESITFFTQDEAFRAPALIKILEQNQQFVPDALRQMAIQAADRPQTQRYDNAAPRQRTRHRNEMLDPFTGEVIGYHKQ